MLQVTAAARVLKPLAEGGARAARELAVYRRLFPEVPVPPAALLGAALLNGAPTFERRAGTAEDIAALRALVPTFHGVVHVPVAPDVPWHHFLSLEDLCHGHARPCVADLKIGTRTYDPHASADKAAKETGKYVWQAQLGFRITGMQVVRPGGDAAAPVRYDRFYGRTLTPDTVEDGLALFFGLDADANAPTDAAGGGFTRHAAGITRRAAGRGITRRAAGVVAEVRRQLLELHAWFVRQRTFRFYSSSVLVTYDAGDAVLDSIDAAAATAAAAAPDGDGAVADGAGAAVRVRLIDFAHAYGWDEVDADDGCVQGLRTLASLLERIHARASA